MAKVKIQGHASGTGVITLTAPNTSTDRTVVLPDADVTLGADNTKLPLAGGTLTGDLNIGSVGSVTSSGADLKITGTDDIFFNVAGASNNILQLYGGSSANDQSKFDSHVHPLTDNSKDLGNSSERWKDLYLSGGLKIGGTTASNTLDDYEEGTCNMRFKADGSSTLVGSSSATYVKIGKMVTVQADMSGTLSSLTQNANMNLDGLPFTPNGAGSGTIFTRYLETPSDTTNVVGYYNSLAASIEVWFMPNHANYVRAKVQDFHNTNNDIYFTITYFTNS